MTEDEQSIADSIKRAILMPRYPAYFRVLHTGKSSYKGLPLRSYALGFHLPSKSGRDILISSAKGLLDRYWNLNGLIYDESGTIEESASYDFDTVVFRDVNYFIKDKTEEVSIRLLLLKDDKEVCKHDKAI